MLGHIRLALGRLDRRRRIADLRTQDVPVLQLDCFERSVPDLRGGFGTHSLRDPPAVRKCMFWAGQSAWSSNSTDVGWATVDGYVDGFGTFRGEFCWDRGSNSYRLCRGSHRTILLGICACGCIRVGRRGFLFITRRSHQASRVGGAKATRGDYLVRKCCYERELTIFRRLEGAYEKAAYAKDDRALADSCRNSSPISDKDAPCRSISEARVWRNW
jgi:hypothetical protein